MEIREAQRQAFCRGCDSMIHKGTLMFHTYSWRNRGQNIHFCMLCVDEIQNLRELYEHNHPEDEGQEES